VAPSDLLLETLFRSPQGQGANATVHRTVCADTICQEDWMGYGAKRTHRSSPFTLWHKQNALRICAPCRADFMRCEWDSQTPWFNLPR